MPQVHFSHYIIKRGTFANKPQQLDWYTDNVQMDYKTLKATVLLLHRYDSEGTRIVENPTQTSFSRRQETYGPHISGHLKSIPSLHFAAQILQNEKWRVFWKAIHLGTNSLQCQPMEAAPAIRSRTGQYLMGRLDSRYRSLASTADCQRYHGILLY